MGIERGSRPEVEEVGETTFCMNKLMSSEEVPQCGGLSQLKCGSSYTKTVDHGKSIALTADDPVGGVPRVTALANTKNPMYQACVWEKGVCKGSQSEGGHEAVVFCGGWCEGPDNPAEKRSQRPRCA